MESLYEQLLSAFCGSVLSLGFSAQIAFFRADPHTVGAAVAALCLQETPVQGLRFWGTDEPHEG